MSVRCTTCGEKDDSKIKSTVIKKYMSLQAYYRDLLNNFNGKIPVNEQYYCRGRNAVLTELMEELGLRRNVKKPLYSSIGSVNKKGKQTLGGSKND